MMFSFLPLNIGDAFCFICLPNMTDVATNDDRTTEATQGKRFCFSFRWLSHSRRVLNFFGLWSILSFFFEACPFRSMQWFLGAISCAEQFCRVHTFYISVLGGICTASDHQKPSIHIMYWMKCRIVSNSSARSRCVIVCEQSRTSSMVMPAWRSRGIDRALFCCFRVERNVRHMRAVEGCECVVYNFM